MSNHSHSLLMDQVTLLRTLDPTKVLTKQFIRQPSGEIQVKNYDRVKTFRCEQKDVGSIQELSQLLQSLEMDRPVMMIRGEPLPDVDLTQPVLRRIHPQGEDRAYFHRIAQRRYVTLDLDHWKLPDHLDLIPDPLTCIEWALEQLPWEFQNVSCHWQWSASTGVFSQKELNAHLTFWLDRSVDDEELQHYFSSVPDSSLRLDLALFNAVQPHYTAAPIFLNMKDPLSVRNGFVMAEQEWVNFPVLETKSHTPPDSGKTISNPLGKGFDYYLNRMGDDQDGFYFPLRSAIASLAATQGDLADWEKAKQKLATRVLQAPAGYRSKAVIQGYAQEDRLNRMWQEALVKFGDQAQPVPSAFRPRLHSGVPGPAIPVYVPVEQAVEKMKKILQDWWSHSQEQGLLLKVTSGVGKSRAAVRWIQEQVQTQQLDRVRYLCPTTNLMKELQRVYGSGSRVIHGRTYQDENGKAWCDRSALVQSLQGKVPSLTFSLCRYDDPGTHPTQFCPYYSSCLYMQQFRQAQQASVLFMSHEYAFHKWDHLNLPEPDLVVVDESILPAMLLKQELTEERFLQDAGPQRTLAVLLVNALKKQQDLFEVLAQNGWNPDKLVECKKGLHKYISSQRIDPGMKDETIQKIGNRLSKNWAYVIFDGLSKEWKSDPSRKVCYSLAWQNEQLQLQYRRALQFPPQTKILFLDATGDSQLLQVLVSSLLCQEIQVRQNLHLVQTYGYRASHTSLKPDQDERAQSRLEQIQEFINNAAQLYTVGAVFAQKDVAERLEMPLNWMKGHFNNLRGLNQFEQAKVGIVLGRLQPNYQDIERLARALCFDQVRVLTFVDSDTQLYPDELKGFCMEDASQYGVFVPTHPDPICHSILEQTREAEIIQAIGRLRGVHSQEPKLIILLNELPLPLPVQQLVPYKKLLQDDRFTTVMSQLQGILPLHSQWMVDRFPKLWNSIDAFKSDLKRFYARAGKPSSTFPTGDYRLYLLLQQWEKATLVKYRTHKSSKYSTCYTFLSELETQARLVKLLGDSVEVKTPTV